MKNVNRIMNVKHRTVIMKIRHRNQPVRRLKRPTHHVNSIVIVNLNYVNLRKWFGINLQSK